MRRTVNQKAKKSYSLSNDSVTFLEDLRKKHRARSVSAVLEDLVQNARRQEELRMYEAKTTEFYDSLTDAEREEERGWGELGLRALLSSDF
jgi:hypothetical protein